MMAELTDEQVEKAVNIASATRTSKLSWNGSTGENGIHLWRATMRAAAPFLQLPWDFPTPEEVDAANTKTSRYGLIPRDMAAVIIDRFVSNRNAFLLPKAVDLRKKAVMMLLADIPGTNVVIGDGNREYITDLILAALDEVK